MKNRLFYIGLGVEALACVLLSVFSATLTEYFTSIFAFPFEQLAVGLKSLSHTGEVGNGLALALLILLGCLVLQPVIWSPKTRGRRLEDILCAVCAAAVVLTVWLMANPSKLLSLSQFSSTDALPTINACLGITVWALVVCWIIARLLRLFRAGDKEHLLAYLKKMLYVLASFFVAAACLVYPAELVQAMEESQSGTDVFFALLSFVVNMLPYALDLLIAVFAVNFVSRHLADPQGEGAVDAAEKLSKFCCFALLLMSLASAGLNVLQLLMMKTLSDVHVSLDIPVLSIAFTLAALLFARLIAENKRLADDNDLFI